MPAYNRVIVMFSLLLLSGCKIIITVPKGGDVITASGKYICGEGDECSIEVDDFFFEEVFFADTRPGFRFIGWQKKSGGLCGGKQLACHLGLSLYAGNELIRGILDSDQKFYLSPVFEKVEGAYGQGSASQCFHPELYTVGYRSVATYATQVAGVRQLWGREREVLGSTKFEGYDAVQEHYTLTDGEGLKTGEGNYYFGRDLSSTRVLQYGEEQQTFSASDVYIYNYVNRPARVFPYDLEPGERFELDTTAEVTSGFNGSLSSTNVQQNYRWIFEGVETKRLPTLGSQRVCRFRVRYIYDYGAGVVGGDEVLDYYSTENGAWLYQETGMGPVTELIGATINDVIVF